MTLVSFLSQWLNVDDARSNRGAITPPPRPRALTIDAESESDRLTQ
jgi:hypothetical protein